VLGSLLGVSDVDRVTVREGVGVIVVVGVTVLVVVGVTDGMTTSIVLANSLVLLTSVTVAVKAPLQAEVAFMDTE